MSEELTEEEMERQMFLDALNDYMEDIHNLEGARDFEVTLLLRHTGGEDKEDILLTDADDLSKIIVAIGKLNGMLDDS